MDKPAESGVEKPNQVLLERMVVIESLDGKETMQPTQEVDDIVDPDKNIAMAGPTGEVFNIDVVPDDQAVSVVREKELDRLYKAYVAGITALLEYVVKPTKVDHEDLDKSDIDSVVTSCTNDMGSLFEELSDTMPYFHNMGIDDSKNVSGYGQGLWPIVKTGGSIAADLEVKSEELIKDIKTSFDKLEEPFQQLGVPLGVPLSIPSEKVGNITTECAIWCA